MEKKLFVGGSIILFLFLIISGIIFLSSLATDSSNTNKNSTSNLAIKKIKVPSASVTQMLSIPSPSVTKLATNDSDSNTFVQVNETALNELKFCYQQLQNVYNDVGVEDHAYTLSGINQQYNCVSPSKFKIMLPSPNWGLSDKTYNEMRNFTADIFTEETDIVGLGVSSYYQAVSDYIDNYSNGSSNQDEITAAQGVANKDIAKTDSELLQIKQDIDQ